jgi:hypothetical protein
LISLSFLYCHLKKAKYDKPKTSSEELQVLKKQFAVWNCGCPANEKQTNKKVRNVNLQSFFIKSDYRLCTVFEYPMPTACSSATGMLLLLSILHKELAGLAEVSASRTERVSGDCKNRHHRFPWSGNACL